MHSHLLRLPINWRIQKRQHSLKVPTACVRPRAWTIKFTYCCGKRDPSIDKNPYSTHTAKWYTHIECVTAAVCLAQPSEGAIASIINSLLLHNSYFHSTLSRAAARECELRIYIKNIFSVSRRVASLLPFAPLQGDAWCGKEFNLNYDHNWAPFIALFYVSCSMLYPFLLWLRWKKHTWDTVDGIWKSERNIICVPRRVQPIFRGLEVLRLAPSFFLLLLLVHINFTFSFRRELIYAYVPGLCGCAVCTVYMRSEVCARIS